MLNQSSAFAEARRLSRMALGAERLDARLDLVTAVGLFDAQIQMVSSKVWHLDIPIDVLQRGRISDVERWYDRFLRQFLAYWNLHSARSDPPWTAVTGYYCAFFGAQTLMGLLGLGPRAFPGLGVLPPGLYRMSESPSLYPDRVLLVFRKQSGSSHRSLWTQLLGMLAQLAAIPGNDAATLLTIESLRQLALGPPGLAETRNQINYSIDFAPEELGAWRSEFAACTSVTELEHRLQVTAPTHQAHRFELVALATITEQIAVACARECVRQQVDLHAVARLIDAYAWAMDRASTRAQRDAPDPSDIRKLAEVIDPAANPAGRYRKVAVAFDEPGPNPTDWREVPEAMDRMLDALSDSSIPTPLASEATAAFLSIHPFVDGNGRVAFVLYNWLAGTFTSPQPLPDFGPSSN